MPQIDPTKLSVSGLNGAPAHVQEDSQDTPLNRRLKQKTVDRVSDGSIARMPSPDPVGPNVSGTSSLPEQYGDRAVKEENQLPDGYNPKVTNEAQPNNGENKVAGTVGGTPERFDPHTDKFVTDIQGKLDELSKVYQDMQGKIASYHPSKLRTALSAAAGIGTGMLTANPEIGMKFGQQLQYEPRNRQIEPLQAKAGMLETEIKHMQDISGLGAKLEEQNAAQTRAQGTYMRGDAAIRAEQNKENNPEHAVEKVTDPQGNDALVTVPKTGSGSGKTVYTGGVKPGEHAGKFEKTVNPDGTVSIIDKTTNKATPVTGPDGQPIKEKTQEEQGFDAYWKSLPDNQKTPENALKWPKTGASTIAGEREGEAAKKEGKAVDTGKHAALIAQAVDKLKLGDNDKSYEAANKKLDAAAAQYPEIAAVKGEIQKQLRAKYPKASGKKSFNPADIIGAAGSSGTTKK